MRTLNFIIIAILLNIPPLINTQPKKDPISPLNDITISVDFQTIKGPMNQMFKECIGAGRANEGLRADWQQQLKYVKEMFILSC